MGGIFDLSAVIALQAGWKTYKANLNLFKNAFRDQDGVLQVPEAMVDEWHAYLDTNDVEVRASWTLGPPEKPVVGVRLEETPVEVAPLGFFDDTDDGSDYKGMIVNQTVAILTYVPFAEISRALRTVVRAIMLDSVDFFLQIGYVNIDYFGGGDLSVEERLIAEVAPFTQVQRWRGTSHVRSTGNAIVHKNMIVASADVAVGGHQGGVTPTT
jgi:hypothetical protein